MVKFGKILDIIKKMPDFTLMNSVTCSEEDILLAVVVDGKTWTWLCLSWDKIVEKTENDRGKKDNGEVEKIEKRGVAGFVHPIDTAQHPD